MTTWGINYNHELLKSYSRFVQQEIIKYVSAQANNTQIDCPLIKPSDIIKCDIKIFVYQGDLKPEIGDIDMGEYFYHIYKDKKEAVISITTNNPDLNIDKFIKELFENFSLMSINNKE